MAKILLKTLKKGKFRFTVCVLCQFKYRILNQKILELKELGISFTEKVNDKDIIEIEKKEDQSSLFYHGIIFTGPSLKPMLY